MPTLKIGTRMFEASNGRVCAKSDGRANRRMTHGERLSIRLRRERPLRPARW